MSSLFIDLRMPQKELKFYIRSFPSGLVCGYFMHSLWFVIYNWIYGNVSMVVIVT